MGGLHTISLSKGVGGGSSTSWGLLKGGGGGGGVERE